MPCLKLPTVTVPTIPDSLAASLNLSASLSFDPNLCCKLPPVSIPTPPIPIPAAVLNAAVITALNAYIAVVVAYINSLSLPCPIE